MNSPLIIGDSPKEVLKNYEINLLSSLYYTDPDHRVGASIREAELESFFDGHKGFIAGGVFKDLFLHKNMKDIDIFFHSRKDFNDALAYFQKSNDYEPYYVNENCRAFRNKNFNTVVELIDRKFGSVIDILEDFDFTVVKYALIKNADKTFNVVKHKNFEQDFKNKSIRVLPGYSITEPGRLAERILRYTEYGFELDKSSLSTVAEVFSQLVPGVTSKNLSKDFAGEFSKMGAKSNAGGGSYSKKQNINYLLKDYLKGITVKEYVKKSKTFDPEFEWKEITLSFMTREIEKKHYFIVPSYSRNLIERWYSVYSIIEFTKKNLDILTPEEFALISFLLSYKYFYISDLNSATLLAELLQKDDWRLRLNLLRKYIEDTSSNKSTPAKLWLEAEMLDNYAEMPFYVFESLVYPDYKIKKVNLKGDYGRNLAEYRFGPLEIEKEDISKYPYSVAAREIF